MKNDVFPMQQQKLNQLYDELNERRSGGEENIRIKFYDGVPRIVKLPNTQTTGKQEREDENSPKNPSKEIQKNTPYHEREEVPSASSTAILTMLHEKCAKDDPVNYRGITALNTPAQIFTPLLLERLTIWCEENVSPGSVRNMAA
ncbi:hypothetical protein JTB14_003071 [Gonioctena quinquepunctata]|nr:hypothetical protein JTB14_003071 [Gonioctena quinquepunctata]